MHKLTTEKLIAKIYHLRDYITHGRLQGITAAAAASKYQEVFSGEIFEIPDLFEYQCENPIIFKGHRAIVPPTYLYEFSDAICISDREEVFTRNRKLVSDLTSQHINPLLGKSQRIISRIDRYLQGKTLHLSLSHFEDNYYGYSVEFLARWWIFRESCIEVDHIITPQRNRFQKELSEILGIAPNKIISEDGITLQCENLIVPSLINNHSNYRIGRQQLYSKQWLPSWLKRAYETIRNQTTPATQGQYNPRIYITRRNASLGRRVLNEQDLVTVLQKYNFDIIDLDNLSVNEQIHTFRSAETIIAPHGAGLVNISYCKNKARILELYPNRYHDNGFRLQSHLMGHEYHFIADKNPTKITENHQYSDLTVDIKRVEDWILNYL